MSKDHYDLGRQHSLEGQARYKFQDPYLQKCYNKGYDGEGWLGVTELKVTDRAKDSLEEYMRDQQNRRKW